MIYSMLREGMTEQNGVVLEYNYGHESTVAFLPVDENNMLIVQHEPWESPRLRVKLAHMTAKEATVIINARYVGWAVVCNQLGLELNTSNENTIKEN